MARDGFDQLERQLHVVLPAAVRRPGDLGEYDEPIEPEAILDPEASIVWGGMMLPDAIPLVGNGGGDVILVRFALDGSVRELVEWHHEGCFWHPTDLVPDFAAPVAPLEREARAALVSGLEEQCLERGGENLAGAVGVPWATMAAWLADTDQVDPPARARIRSATSLTDSQLFSQQW